MPLSKQEYRNSINTTSLIQGQTRLISADKIIKTRFQFG